MRVSIIGAGYVGLVSGVCFADFGHEVTCIDADPSKIERLRKGVMPIYEPGLDDLVARNVEAGRLRFSDDLDGIENAEVVFLAVGTPSRRGDGHADLTYVFAAAEEIAPRIGPESVVVTKSTVPVGTGDRIEEIVSRVRGGASVSVASNPEFLREGAAIEDFKRPDRVVIGVEDERSERALRELYRPLFLNETPIMVTDRRTAELTKYAANAFLATKIAFINEIADLCESIGANVQDVARGMGLDKRIGGKFLNAGPGYGGSCFPKDTLALSHSAHQVRAPVSIVDAVVSSNARRKSAMAQRVIQAAGGSVRGKTIAVLGLTFKPNTDDMRDAPSLVVIPALQAEGATVRAYDPEGAEEAAKLLDGVEFASDPYSCMEGADLAVLITEWDQFRALDLSRMASLLKDRALVDLRNVYREDQVARAGLHYHSIGRPPRAPEMAAEERAA